MLTKKILPAELIFKESKHLPPTALHVRSHSHFPLLSSMFSNGHPQARHIPTTVPLGLQKVHRWRHPAHRLDHLPIRL